MNILATIVAPFVALGVALGSLVAPAPEPQLGASEAIPVVVAFFETTLATAIGSTDTSFTLTSATDKDGTTLASSTYAFVIDEGSSNEEIVIADCTGTACTNALRGVSVLTGNTEVTALKKSHRRGASIKITDAPILMLVSRILRGEEVVTYTPTQDGSLATKEYVDNLALGTTTVSATLTDDGIVELATGTQAASSTATDQSGSPLALHTGISTSTAPTSGAYVVVTGQDGNIADGFVTFASTTAAKVGDTPLMSIGKSFYASTSVGTSTWSVPSGVTVIKVTVTGGGNSGGGCSVGGSTWASGGGGGAGATAISWIDVSSTTSIQFVVGTYGAPSKFANIIANPGSVGASEGAGGAGGVATGGSINLPGGGGGGGSQDVSGAYASKQGGLGGASYWGGGPYAVTLGISNGVVADVPGAGGGGATCDDGTAGGGAGAPGMILIEY